MTDRRGLVGTGEGPRQTEHDSHRLWEEQRALGGQEPDRAPGGLGSFCLTRGEPEATAAPLPREHGHWIQTQFRIRGPELAQKLYRERERQGSFLQSRTQGPRNRGRRAARAQKARQSTRAGRRGFVGADESAVRSLRRRL